MTSASMPSNSAFSGAEPPLPPALQGRVPVLVTIAMPADTNPVGDIFGGWLLAQMDMAAGSKAYTFTGGKTVKTRALDEMEFKMPVYVGDKVSFYGDVVHIGNTSMKVKIECWALRRKNLQYEKVTEGTFTMVAIGPDGKPTPVSGAPSSPSP